MVETGYGLADAFRRQGLATEAVDALVAIALSNGASQVRADTTVNNRASQRVLEKTGFRELSRSDSLVFYAR